MSARTLHIRIRRKSSCRESAFTLIEILVVVVIVGIISGIAMLSLGLLGDDRNLQRDARRLGSLIELVNDEAMLQGRDYGLEFLQSGYRFVEHDPLTEQWYEVIDDDMLRPRQLAEQTEFELFLEDRKVLLHTDSDDLKYDEEDDDPASNARDRDLTDDYLPHVLIMSSGDITPFELTLVRQYDQAAITISASIVGEIEIKNEDQ
ncbi:MAG: general secretion pathway protein H [Woeseiaceae bacterium]|jgi:general secretion pathway protein H